MEEVLPIDESDGAFDGRFDRHEAIQKK